MAVASMEGLFVNQHLGEATGLWIFGEKDGTGHLSSAGPPRPRGRDRAMGRTVERLGDCNTVLASGIGPIPVCSRTGRHKGRGDGRPGSEGVEAILKGREIPKILLRPGNGCGIGKQCTGGGTGCG